MGEPQGKSEAGLGAGMGDGLVQTWHNNNVLPDSGLTQEGRGKPSGSKVGSKKKENIRNGGSLLPEEQKKRSATVHYCLSRKHVSFQDVACTKTKYLA